MAGQENLVKEAIENPETVHQGNTPDHKMFKGFQIPGTGFKFGGGSIVAVVFYRPVSGGGELTTAYLTILSPQGKVLWKHP